MPSVTVTWSGRCQKAPDREELCLRMNDLAELSHSYFETNPPEIKRYDREIEGRILLSPHLFSSPPTSARLARVNETYFSLNRVSLFGIEFRLYDGRRLYSGDDRMSFVFCVDEDPQLNGLMVYVEDKEECRKFPDEQLQQADYFLEIPHIHLRYYLEEWMDGLMGWTKYHYIDDLKYWRYEERFCDGDFLRDRYDRVGRYEYYERLKKELAREVADWTGISKTARTFWKAARDEPGNAD